ncbi:lysozyme inhibitor LprI family protein [Flavobacterium sp.]|uniref:lysozyme inhibitor LprI family protein n=1 Tax=Flavobacterium sp. TaxID=239 RepID=UPI0037539200
MKKIILTIVISLISIYSFSQTQYDMNQEENDKFKLADKELNSTYQKILKEYKTYTAFLKNLKISQNIWIKFRDAEMKTKYPDRGAGYYGSVQPMCWSIHLTQLTNERTNDLKIWLTGIEEGSVCSGSVNIK